VESEEQLQNTLAMLKKLGKLPVVIIVKVDKEPFKSDLLNSGAGGDEGGYHAVTITDYDPGDPNANPARKPSVSIPNQWGAKADHSVPGKQINTDVLAEAMGASSFG
jgi:hypothetical protein